MDETPLSDKELQQLVVYCGETLAGGKLVSSRHYQDATGEPRIRAMVDYGIGGLKKFDASVEAVARKSGSLEPRLEDLGELELRALANTLGVAVQGRPNRVKLVVEIRKAMAVRQAPPAPPVVPEVEEPALPGAVALASEPVPGDGLPDDELDEELDEDELDALGEAGTAPQQAEAQAKPGKGDKKGKR
jgi:hypothetical protein